MVFQNDRKEGFYPSADSVHDADSAYFRDDLDGFHMSASRSCCALPAWFEDVRLAKAGAAAAPAVVVPHQVVLPIGTGFIRPVSRLI